MVGNATSIFGGATEDVAHGVGGVGGVGVTGAVLPTASTPTLFSPTCPKGHIAREKDTVTGSLQIRYGLAAPSSFSWYQDPDRLTFSTFSPVWGASIMSPPPTYMPT